LDRETHGFPEVAQSAAKQPVHATGTRMRPTSETNPKDLHALTSPRLSRSAAITAFVQARLARLGRFALASFVFFNALPALADADADETTRYHVEIDAPSPVKGAVERSLDLVRWQNYAGLNPELLELLITDAKAQARAAAEAEGYFAAKVTGALDESTKPPTVRIRVEPGEPTLVVDVAVEAIGPVTEAVDGADAIAAMRGKWLLPQGSIFRQADWTAAKAAAVQTLAASRYAAAKLVASEADIDPETRAAHLRVAIDSGPPFRFGALEISGLEKYSETTVRNLVTFATGDSYSAETLKEFVRRLNATGYFASAQATVAPEPEHAASAPVKVTLIEAPTKKFSGGIGFATDVLYLAQLSFDNVNLDGHGLQFRSDLRVDSKQQDATVRFTLAPRTPEYSDSFIAKLDHTDISGLTTRDLAFGWTRRTSDPRDQTTYSTYYYISKQEPPQVVLERSHALYAEVGHEWRRVDDLLAPTQGYVINAQLGGGPPGVSTRAFGRGIVQVAGWIPIDAKTQIGLRAEAGAVAASTSDGIPAPLLFRTGGDTTVRGYAFQSLGPRVGDATIGGRYYALATAEVVRWIGASWGIATFVDAGNAADRVHDLKPVYGYGVGGRLRTPIGPFRLDLAYGEATKSVRVHLSVGLAF
jgi:translocation and assembly module TamA